MTSGIKRSMAAVILVVATLSGVTLAFAKRDLPPVSTVAAAKPKTSGLVARAIVPIETPRPEPTPVAAAYVVKRVLDVHSPMAFGEWHWDDKGIPTGPVIMTVDLDAETISVFRAGYEIGTAVILYGADVKPTPLGVFAITQKDADHHSNIYGGAPMPYMMRLTNDGVSIHGSDVKAGYMTHGCVGVPTAFAKRLFAQARIGDTVIVTNGERLNVGRAIKAAKI